MAILKVEPLTTARALRGPFDYRRPAAMEGLEVGSVVRVPFGPRRHARRRRRAGREPPSCRRSGCRADRGARGGRAAGAGRARPLGRPRVLLDALARPAAGAAAGDRDRAARTRPLQARAAGGDPAGRRGGAERRRAARGQAAGGAGGAARRARCRRRSWPRRSAPTAQTLRRLEERGLIATRELAPAPRARAARASRPRPSAPQLLPEQQAAVEAIVAALDGEAGAPREQLLHGVTGSGKTEVYLAAVEAALERGRGAIVLVPEIGLAPQAVARFRARLGDRFAVLHSALSAGERYDEWRRLRSGEASVCVGPRSAVFAPVRDLGLIVIDEEHDPSYKQEGDPSYDARAVARRRAEERGAVLVAGTATPRPETWLELPRLELPRPGRRPAACRRSTWSTCARPTRARGRCTPRPGRRWRRSAPPAPRRS